MSTATESLKESVSILLDILLHAYYHWFVMSERSNHDNRNTTVRSVSPQDVGSCCWAGQDRCPHPSAGQAWPCGKSFLDFRSIRHGKKFHCASSRRGSRG